MIYVLLAAVCSVLVSVLLKLARQHDVDAVQAIGWNYLAASILCWLLLSPSLNSLSASGAPWLSLLGLAFVLPTLFIVLASCVRRAGIVLSDIAQRLSLLLSLAAAFLFFGETAGWLKLAGFGVGLLAMVAIVVRPTRYSGSEGARAWPVLLTVWIGFALVDVMLKHIAMAGTPFAPALQASFGLAFLGMMGWLGVRAARGQGRLTLRSCVVGLLLGTLNFGNILFYVMAHRALGSQPAIVFAMMNVGVVVLGTLAGALVFREPLSRLNRVGIILAIGAIVLIALGKQA